MKKPVFSPTQLEIIRAYIKLIGKRIIHPSLTDLEKIGITKAKIRHHFQTLQDLREAAKAYSPDTFLNIIDSSIFSPKHLQSIRTKAENRSTFVITTAVTGCQVHAGFLASIKRFCERNKAMMIVLPATDPAARAGWTLDAKLKREAVLHGELKLNDNCFLSKVKLSAKHIDPATGMDHIVQRRGSFIYASPKQRLRVVPTSGEYPRIGMTTGAITHANYETDRYLSDRTAYISTVDHTIGALIVEVVDDEIFHFRQVQAEKSGAFVDMGVYYKPDGIGKLLPIARILGDYHAGQHDPIAEAAFMRLQAKVPAASIIFHDLFNGLSVNHHESNKHILRSIRYRRGQLCLESEFKSVVEVLDRWSEVAEKLHVVASNHNEFLNKYLDEGRYVKDYQNKLFALELALEMAREKNPLRHGVENMLGLKNPKALNWLDRKAKLILAGVRLSQHGDEYGATNMKNQSNVYGDAVTAHLHAPGIWRGIFRVGTTSLMDLDYNVGPSGWMHTGCDLYPNGARSLISVIAGKYCANDSAKA